MKYISARPRKTLVLVCFSIYGGSDRFELMPKPGEGFAEPDKEVAAGLKSVIEFLYQLFLGG